MTARALAALLLVWDRQASHAGDTCARAARTLDRAADRLSRTAGLLRWLNAATKAAP